MKELLSADPHIVLGMIRAVLESDRLPRQKTAAIGDILIQWDEVRKARQFTAGHWVEFPIP